jgi:hypothetical protein
VVVLFVKRWAGLRVLVCAGGPAGSVTLPLCWTDAGPAGGAGRLTVDGLVELARLVSALGSVPR